jgi:hypothetical protein
MQIPAVRPKIEAMVAYRPPTAQSNIRGHSEARTDRFLDGRSEAYLDSPLEPES